MVKFLNVIQCIIFLFFVSSSSSHTKCRDPTIITLPNGKIRGHILQTGKGNGYYAFQEIPYAAPPINDLRFKEPVAANRLDGILDTTRNTKICHQLFPPRIPQGTVQTEDCLYLNVYVPQNAKKALPVLVWIHGGGNYGDGTFQTYGPQFYIDYGIIVVTMNYRVGALGFLTTEDGVIPGNLGLKDQNFALRWVKQNIGKFGGNPDKVTISGESAGASYVGLQIVSKKSKGLFRGAIMQSGTSIMSYSNQPFARELAFQLGRKLDESFTSESSTELLELLRRIPAANITATQVTSPWKSDPDSTLWRPVVENKDLEGAFITGPMHEDIKNGNINKVPILLGFNSEEVLTAAVYAGPLLKQGAIAYDNDLKTMVDVIFNMTDEDKTIAARKLRKIYTDGTFGADFGAFVRYLGDLIFSTPAARQADLESKYTDVYLYQFSYSGLLGRLPVFGNITVDVEGVDPNGVGHAEDLTYFWDDGTNTDVTKFPAKDRLVQSYLLKLWTNFVKHLNPTPTRDSSLENIIWQKVSPGRLRYLNINSTLEVKTDPKEYKKWKQIIDEYAIPPLTVY